MALLGLGGRGCLGCLLLLAHALKLLVDLLGRFDSVGGVWLRRIGGGCAVWSSRVDRRIDGRRCGGRLRLFRLGRLGPFRPFRSVIDALGVWIGRGGATHAGGEDELRVGLALAMY